MARWYASAVWLVGTPRQYGSLVRLGSMAATSKHEQHLTEPCMNIKTFWMDTKGARVGEKRQGHVLTRTILILDRPVCTKGYGLG